MNIKLTKNEQEFIIGVQKITSHKVQNYILVSLLYSVAIIGVLLGFLFKSKDGFLLALFFCIIGSFILITIKVYSKFYLIIKKCQIG